jgi:hypothetical protein
MSEKFRRTWNTFREDTVRYIQYKIEEYGMTDWIRDRIKERTSIDGITLIAICGFIILFGGVAKLIAWAGLVWGIVTLIKKES